MSHSYPLAESAEDALTPDYPAARTRAEAERQANGREIVSLETEWLNVSDADAENMLARADATMGMGFVQRYEDAGGAPVLAVTYWKLGTELSSKSPAKPARKAPETVSESESQKEDHTDDLYFRSGRTKPRRGRKPKIDPNQMDLFSAPDD